MGAVVENIQRSHTHRRNGPARADHGYPRFSLSGHHMSFHVVKLSSHRCAKPHSWPSWATAQGRG